ncbi:MAG: hypothetical protein H6573_00810 [Lewinellaceae bacterium]|nr:hypothetical protein [Phaeodactylibacter sp.]MCB0615170.1 hypothetical protein [Phaeodactylibacter sp.]MCB9346036.1 hypothetical protein [Lewinellaceae bacterium]
MKTLALLSLLLISGSLLAQNYNEQVVIVEQSRRYLTYGDLTYTKDFRGLSMFMENLMLEENPLYQKMQPRYIDIKQKRATSTGIIVGGSVVSMALFIRGTAQLIDDGDQLGAKPNYTSFIASLVVIGGSTILSRSIYNREREMLGFINAFNSQSEGIKLQLMGGLQPGAGGMYGGLGVKWRF